jgi:DNA replication protein DnaC
MKHEELISNLKQLHLHEISAQYFEVAKSAEKNKQTYEQYLATLVEIELIVKNQQKVDRFRKEAKIPIHKSLETYNFAERKGITLKEINRLATGEFLRSAGNIVFYGSFGVGKTHLAIALTDLLCQAGFRCLCITTHNLIAQLQLAKRDLQLASLFKRTTPYHPVFFLKKCPVKLNFVGAVFG